MRLRLAIDDPRGDAMAGQPEHMVALVRRHPQPRGYGREHLHRRDRPTLLLDPAVVIGRHARQRGDLLTAQPAGPPPRPARQAHVLGLQRLLARAQQIGELGAVHHSSMPARHGISRANLSLGKDEIPVAGRIWGPDASSVDAPSVDAIARPAPRSYP
jgi:hypothetical protein